MRDIFPFKPQTISIYLKIFDKMMEKVHLRSDMMKPFSGKGDIFCVAQESKADSRYCKLHTEVVGGEFGVKNKKSCFTSSLQMEEGVVFTLKVER